jgi:hypothetical protein
MNTTAATTPRPDVPLPQGFSADVWEPREPNPPYRILFGDDRTVADHDVRVSTEAVQHADGRIEEAKAALLGQRDTGIRLNSDQARELAAALLEAADEIDGWAAR